MPFDTGPTRRALAFGLAATVTALPQFGSARAQDGAGRTVRAAPLRRRLRPEAREEAELWALDGEAPGAPIRIRHGDELRLRLVNETPKPLSLHWHGVRGPSAMDGVAGLTQAPVAPGQSFDYRLTPPDAGTFLVRPLVLGGSSEPAGRGLSALLIVEERDPPRLDAEFALVVDDWRVEESGALAPFGAVSDASTTGRLGNVLTVSAGAAPQALQVAPGARVRLRIANACNARAMRIRFDGLKAYIAAIDGQPTDTFEPLRATVPFAPGTRYDVLMDMPAEAGAKGALVALLGQGTPLVTLEAAGEPASRRRPALPPIAALAPNKLLPPEIKLQNAIRKSVVIQGGATAGADGQYTYAGDPARIWTINGAAGSPERPLFSAKRGSPVVLTVENRTPAIQPLHLHGHVMRLLHERDDGWEPYFLDTVQVPEARTVHIALLADNPGKWAISSTVLERFDTGLWTWFEVT
jgi:FtsP/CotA-like multicopper oxidase with cupredoxin domain